MKNKYFLAFFLSLSFFSPLTAVTNAEVSAAISSLQTIKGKKSRKETPPQEIAQEILAIWHEIIAPAWNKIHHKKLSLKFGTDSIEKLEKYEIALKIELKKSRDGSKLNVKTIHEGLKRINSLKGKFAIINESIQTLAEKTIEYLSWIKYEIETVGRVIKKKKSHLTDDAKRKKSPLLQPYSRRPEPNPKPTKTAQTRPKHAHKEPSISSTSRIGSPVIVADPQASPTRPFRPSLVDRHQTPTSTSAKRRVSFATTNLGPTIPNHHTNPTSPRSILKQPAGKKVCPTCTFLNPASAYICEMCEMALDEDKIACRSCTALNSVTQVKCYACDNLLHDYHSYSPTLSTASRRAASVPRDGITERIEHKQYSFKVYGLNANKQAGNNCGAEALCNAEIIAFHLNSTKEINIEYLNRYLNNSDATKRRQEFNTKEKTKNLAKKIHTDTCRNVCHSDNKLHPVGPNWHADCFEECMAACEAMDIMKMANIHDSNTSFLKIVDYTDSDTFKKHAHYEISIYEPQALNLYTGNQNARIAEAFKNGLNIIIIFYIKGKKDGSGHESPGHWVCTVYKKVDSKNCMIYNADSEYSYNINQSHRLTKEQLELGATLMRKSNYP